MDLEFKILREKVSEDEKKASIGSLYDDDKTSHQHITLLKQKYAEMLQNFHKTMTKLQKKDLEIKEQSFLLNTTLKHSKDQNETLKKEFDDFKRETTAQVKERNKEYTKINRERTDLEQEVVSTLKNELDRTAETRFEHTMILTKEDRFEAIAEVRNTEECKLLTELIKKKKEERDNLVKGQEEYQKAWNGHTELQDAIGETTKLRAEIEKMKVEV